MAKKTAKKIRITLLRSGIGRPERQKNTLTGLGLTRLNKAVIRDDTPEIRGMVGRVSHLVAVEAI